MENGNKVDIESESESESEVESEVEEEKISYKEKEYYRLYYHKTNKPVICDCGKKVNFRNMCKHIKTKKHRLILNI